MSGLDHRQVSGHGPRRRRERRRPRPRRPVRRVRRARAHLRRERRARARASPTGRPRWPRPCTPLTSTPLDEIWQVAQFDREVARIAAGAADTGTTLRQADVRALLQQRLRGRPTRVQLPHRHADGLHDGADALGAPPRRVPRRARRRRVPAGLDGRRRRRAGPAPAHRRARPARRGPPAVPRRDRGGDRHARHHLHRPRRAHRRRAPAGRAARRAARRARPHDGRSRCATTSSPTTRCSPSTRPTSSPGGCAGTRAFTFDRFALAGASAARSDREAVGVLVPTPLPVADATPQDVSLADLQDFFAHPVRGFFRRLRIARPYDADEIKDAIPITLDALEKWAVGDRLISNVMAGARPAGGHGGGAAQRDVAAGRARGRRPDRHRQQRQAARGGRAGPASRTPAQPRRRHRPRWRPPALRHGRRRVGQQRGVGVLLQPRRQAPPRRLDQRPRPRRRPPRRELDGPHDRQAPLRRAGRS